MGKIKVFQFDDQNWNGTFSAKKLQVGGLDLFQIGVADVLLKSAASFADLVHQSFYGAMQVYQQIRPGKGGIQHIEQALKQAVFLFLEVVFGKQQGFDKKIIGDDRLLKQVGLGQFLLELFVPLSHKKQLNRKSVTFGVVVKKGQKGIVGKLFQNQATAVFSSQLIGQGGFASPDIALDGDELVWKGVVVHNQVVQIRSTFRGSGQAAASSRMLFCKTGWQKSGAISSSGCNTKLRSWIKGWGMVSRWDWETRLP